MIKLKLCKFSETEYLIVMLDNAGGKFNAEVLDCVSTLKHGHNKLNDYLFLQNKSKPELAQLMKMRDVVNKE